MINAREVFFQVAADLGVVVAPPVVIVPAPVLVPVVPHIWLGHFTGGARTEVPGVMDWRDEFQRFASRRECLHWLNALKRAYRAQEGFKTCLPITNIGTPVTPASS